MMCYFKMLLFHFALFCYLGQVISYSIDIQKARNEISKVKDYLNDKDKSETDDTDGMFEKVLVDFKEEPEKKFLLSQVVPLYMKMLDSINDSVVKDSITDLSQMLVSNEDLLNKSDEKLKALYDLKKLKMTDVKVQRSAIKHLLRILHIFSSLEKKPNHVKCKREKVRRRRGC
ncbi:interferon gamma [Hyperolius riggenbachi]|uniref:interferon gamma n=1 Tax=Hyperolius riggenbachi TaxID=752182 RepID=UPI0035A39DE5